MLWKQFTHFFSFIIYVMEKGKAHKMDEEDFCCSKPDYRLVNSEISNDGFDNFYRVNRFTCSNCGNHRYHEYLIPEDNGKEIPK